MINIVQGAAYIGPYTEFSWIPTIAVIIIGIFLFIILYKLVLSKLRGPKEVDKKEVPDVPPVIVHQETINPDGTVKLRPKEENVEEEDVILTPMSGRLMRIDEVPDPIFSERMVGDGFAIEPDKGEIYAPVKGIVMQIYSNKDALTIKSCTGKDVILHIGINTSKLKGEGILFEVKEGDQVEAGDQIGRIALETVMPKVTSLISPVVFPSLKEDERVVIRQTGKVKEKMGGIIVIEKR